MRNIRENRKKSHIFYVKKIKIITVILIKKYFFKNQQKCLCDNELLNNN